MSEDTKVEAILVNTVGKCLELLNGKNTTHQNTRDCIGLNATYVIKDAMKALFLRHVETHGVN